MQAQNPFLEKFIEKYGKAYWDKALVQYPAPSIITSNDTVYAKIPMAIQNTEIVNSLLLAKITSNFISVGLARDYDFTQLPLEKDATSTHLSKEDFAQIFFKFSKDVFGALDFKINDSLLFQTDSSLAATAAAPIEEREPIYVSLRGNYGIATGTPGVSTCTSLTVYIPFTSVYVVYGVASSYLQQIAQIIFSCTLNESQFDLFPLLSELVPLLPTTGPSATPVPANPWVLAGFALENKSPIDNNENDENNNVVGGYNPTAYPSYTTGNFPTVNNVIPVNNPSGTTYEFKGWGRNGIARYSMNYNKAQIAEKSQQISNYSDAGQTYNIYDETTGVNTTATNDAIGYIIGALQAGIPVVVGVDCRPGTSNSGGNDNTTDHFVTIVGMGNSGGFNFFRYYDCSTYSLSQGTRSTNKLVYNNLTGIISGLSPTIYANTLGFTPYRITQVRRSKPL